VNSNADSKKGSCKEKGRYEEKEVSGSRTIKSPAKSGAFLFSLYFARVMGQQDSGTQWMVSVFFFR
jgi:hypothetical protein